MSDSPLVSVVLPVRDGTAFLGAALRSVLSQTWPQLEVVVVDDGSTDDSVAIAKSFGDRVRVLPRGQRGVWAARNEGIRQSAGDFLLLQDADDLSAPRRVERQLNLLLSRPDVGIVFGHMVEFRGASAPDLDNLDSAPGRRIAAPCPGTALIRRSAYDRVGAFCENWQLAGFVDWYMRAQDLGIQSLVSPYPILARRVHEANSTRLGADVLHRELLGVIRGGLGRRVASSVA